MTDDCSNETIESAVVSWLGRGGSAPSGVTLLLASCHLQVRERAVLVGHLGHETKDLQDRQGLQERNHRVSSC